VVLEADAAATCYTTTLVLTIERCGKLAMGLLTMMAQPVPLQLESM
jgi:hypothetical protein